MTLLDEKYGGWTITVGEKYGGLKITVGEYACGWVQS